METVEPRSSVVNWVCRYADEVKDYHDKAQKQEGFPHGNESASAHQSQPHDERTGETSLDVVEGDEIFTIRKCENAFIGNKKIGLT